MTKITFDISVSVDGYVAGPNQNLEQPLGEGADRLHEWFVPLEAFRERHNDAGGERGPDNAVALEMFDSVGAYVMGRRMFSSGEGPWESDPKAQGWWGDDPPFRAPVFVLTHHPREPLTLSSTTFTFVTDGIEAAVERARAVADGKNVSVAGGASVIRQALGAGLVDEFQLHISPVFLGGGVRLFERERPEVERTRLIDSPSGVVHVKYRLKRSD